MESENQSPYSDEEIFNTNLMIDDDVSLEDNEEGTGEERGLNLDEASEVVPEVGMKFKDVEELYEFYAKYAYRMGFPIRKRNSRKGEDGILRNVAIACSREGKKMCTTSNSLKPQPTMQTGCKAKLTASSDINGIWRITKVRSASQRSRTNLPSTQNPIQGVGQASREPQYVVINPLSYTQQLMGAQTQSWYQAGGGNPLPTIDMGNSWSSIYQPQIRPFEEEYIGSSGGTETTDRADS